VPAIVSSCAAVLPAVAEPLLTDTIPAYVAAAVADPSRPDADRRRDVDRRPAQVIAFAEVKPGDKVADFNPGKGYFTRILCKVVGTEGRVYAIALARPTGTTAAPAAESQATAAESSGQPCTNVTNSTLQPHLRPAPELHSDSGDPGWVYEYWSSSPAAESFAAPEPLDLIWTSESYHDLHNKGFGSPDMLVVDKALLAALRPGGILVIEDHAAAAGSGTRDTASLHRIAPQQVKEEVTQAGFVFVGESDVLHHADDRHTAKAHDMHDKTDRFLLKFRRPEP
jgi:predicted methyltransferase